MQHIFRPQPVVPMASSSFPHLGYCLSILPSAPSPLQSGRSMSVLLGLHLVPLKSSVLMIFSTDLLVDSMNDTTILSSLSNSNLCTALMAVVFDVGRTYHMVPPKVIFGCPVQGLVFVSCYVRAFLSAGCHSCPTGHYRWVPQCVPHDSQSANRFEIFCDNVLDSWTMFRWMMTGQGGP